MRPRKAAVYFHRNDDNEIIYIGVASEERNQSTLTRTYPRAFVRDGAGRKDDHREYCRHYPVSVSIEYEFEGVYSKREAHSKELELIRTIRPRFNRCGKAD